MKTRLLILLITLISILSCKTAEMDIKELPDFVLNPPISADLIYGVGFGNKSTPSMSMKVAETNARLDIANQIETSIQASMTDYIQEAGVDDVSQTTSFIESITKQITDTTVNGATPIQRVAMDDGGWWILMSYDKAVLTKSFSNALDSFSNSEEALFAEFKATEALDRLNAELEDNPTKSSPVE